MLTKCNAEKMFYDDTNNYMCINLKSTKVEPL